MTDVRIFLCYKKSFKCSSSSFFIFINACYFVVWKCFGFILYNKDELILYTFTVFSIMKEYRFMFMSNENLSKYSNFIAGVHFLSYPCILYKYNMQCIVSSLLFNILSSCFFTIVTLSCWTCTALCYSGSGVMESYKLQ